MPLRENCTNIPTEIVSTTPAAVGTSASGDLDRSAFTTLHCFVLAVAAATIILDGFDIQVLAFAAPQILHEWSLTKAAFGPVLAAALIGMGLGALVGGVLADRFGRRPTLIVSVLAFGLLTLACATSRGAGELMGLRFLTGLGFGGAVPTATALVAEYIPGRFRNLSVTGVLLGVPLGGFGGAALASWLIPVHGWRSCFVVGGALPLILAAVSMRLPESPAFLAPSFQRGTARPTARQPRPEKGARTLLSQKYRRTTAGLWLGFFANLFATYCLINWMPLLLSARGFPVRISIMASLYFNLLGIFGAVIGAYGISRIGSRAILLVTTGVGIAGATIAAIYLLLVTAPVTSHTFYITAALSLAGGALLANQIALYAVSSNAYPTRARATGIGTASSMGRLGAIASAYGSGLVLSLSSGDGIFFSIIALMLLLVGLGAVVIDRHAGARLGRYR